MLFTVKTPVTAVMTIAAGLDQVIDYIKISVFPRRMWNISAVLKFLMKDFLEYLESFHFTGDIYAIPEGTIVLPQG